MGSVVIDEMEVQVASPEPVPPEAAEGREATQPPPAGGLGPDEVRRFIELRDARAARLFAH